MQNFELVCTFAHHHQNPVIGICVSDACSQKRPSCFECSKEFHSQHLNDVLNYQNYRAWVDDIDRKKTKLQEFFREFADFNDFATKLKKQMDELTLNNQSLSFEQLNNQVNQIMQLFKNVENIKPKLDKINQSIQSTYNCILDLRDEYPIRKMVCLNKVQQPFKFSSTLKHENIMWLDQGESIQARASGYCLCEPEIKSFTRLEFQITECEEIYIGICSGEEMQKYQYDMDKSDIWTNSNRGLYLIENDGHSYSHHQEQFNCKISEFKFQKNDIIIMEIDPLAKLITWTKKKENSKFQLSYQFEGNVYAVVGFYKKGEISITNQKQ